MFCTVCGQEIDANENFCSNCGAATKNKNQEEANNCGYTREDIIQHLSDLRTLEVAISKFQKRLQKNEQCFQSLGIAKKFKIDYTYLLLSLFSFIVLGVCIFVEFIIDFKGSIPLFIGLIITLAFFGLISLFSHLVYIRKVRKEQKSDGERVKHELELKDNLEKENQEIKQAISQTKSVLNDAYALNIVPSTYRNIYSIFYLYDYISTSHETLAQALLHCNLDEIKDDIDVMIKNQEDSIIQLAHQTATLNNIQMQNSQLLESVSDIATNALNSSLTLNSIKRMYLWDRWDGDWFNYLFSD